MFECFNLGDARRLQVCKRTNLLLVEFNTVSCSSGSIMEPGTWTGRGYRAPWMYHSMAGQYTISEKKLMSDFSPCHSQPGLQVLQDSTNWHDAQHLAGWGPLKQEGYWFLGKGWGRVASSPKAPRQHSPTYDGYGPVGWRDVSWGTPHTANGDPKGLACGGSATGYRGTQGASAKIRRELHLRAPPSYEAHMLLRLRAQQGSRKENWPCPPPYIAPPSYEAPHHTVQPQQWAGKAAAQGKPRHIAAAKQYQDKEGVWAQIPARKAGKHQTKLPGSWSYLSGARTWGGPRMHLEKAKSPSHLWYGWDLSPQHQNHTLPRVSRRNKVMPVPCRLPQHTLPPGWGFSHAVGWPGPKEDGSRVGRKHCQDVLPMWKQPSPSRELRGSQAAWSQSIPQGHGGLFVIDATCVVIRAHYIPSSQTEHVSYLSQEGASKVKNAICSCSLTPTLMEERAACMMGLPVCEPGVTEPRGQILAPGIPGHRRMEGCAAAAAGSGNGAGTRQPEGTTSAPESPGKALGAPTTDCFQVGPAEQKSASLEKRETATSPGSESGSQAQSKEESMLSAESRSYVQDLREAMLRIRRHTAPDSDTEEELEKEGQPACRPPPWGERSKQELVLGSSSGSSNSLDSSSSKATVVTGSSTLAGVTDLKL